MSAKDRGATAFEEKWGRVVARKGFAQLPNYLFRVNEFFDEDDKLNSKELLILIHLAALWWKKGETPNPSVDLIAKRCGLSAVSVGRTLNSLEKRGFIKRIRRRHNGFVASNAYDLSGLVHHLAKMTVAFSPGLGPREGEHANAVVDDDDLE